jgi:polyisoprenoid-binding protein YceI
MKAAWALALLLLPGLALALAQTRGPQTWPIDPSRSQAQFSVRKLWFAHARGTFTELHGTLRRIEMPNGAAIVEVDATLDVTRLAMADPDHRARALGPDFFDAARYPWIRFDSNPFPLAELVTGGTVSGMLTLHGERHPVPLTLRASTCPGQPLACVIRVRGTIQRSKFGMRGLRGVLSDKVELDLRIALSGDRP